MNLDLILRGNKGGRNENLFLNTYHLDEIPDLSTFEWVKNLSIMNNKITEIKVEHLPPNLEQLDLQKNDIDELKIDKPIKSLKVLNLSYNSIGEFDGSMFPNLVNLEISNNALIEFKDYPPNIEELNIAGNNISELGDFPKSLKKILAEANSLEVLPEMNDGLEHVDFDNNEFVEFPEFPDSVEHIDFNYNNVSTIDHLPEKLKYFSIFNNAVEKINCELPDLIEEIDLSNNSLDDMPTLPPNSKKVDISNNTIYELVDIPESVEEFDCSDNIILDIPQELLLRKNLKISCRDNNAFGLEQDVTEVNGDADDDPFEAFSGVGHRLGNNTQPYRPHYTSGTTYNNTHYGNNYGFGGHGVHYGSGYNVARSNPFANAKTKDDNPDYVSILCKKKVTV